MEKLKAQNDYLDAVEKNDMIKLRELYSKYSGKRPNTTRSGHESPATFETPLTKSKEPSTPHPNSARSSKSSKSTKSSSETDNFADMSLDTFLHTHTSEDNYSFQEIIESADLKLRQKFKVLYEAEQTQAIEMSKLLALPSIEQQFNAVEGNKSIETWNYKNRNYVMYVPDGVSLTKEEEIEMAKRKQEIIHGNTRLHSNPFDERQSQDAISEMAKLQSKGMVGKIGVDGNAMDMGGAPGQVRGFSFVKTPSPCPGLTDSPLMTWGEIEGTPFRLDGSDTPIRPSTGPAFRIAETTRREAIGLELAEKAGERLRGQKAKAIEAAKRNMKSPYVKSSIDRLATMSPAARRLASVKFGLKNSALTPSPHRSTPGKSSKLMLTPLVKKSGQSSSRSGSTPKTPNLITDDLLKIPVKGKRKRAADFF